MKWDHLIESDAKLRQLKRKFDVEDTPRSMLAYMREMLKTRSRGDGPYELIRRGGSDYAFFEIVGPPVAQRLKWTTSIHLGDVRYDRSDGSDPDFNRGLQAIVNRMYSGGQ